MELPKQSKKPNFIDSFAAFSDLVINMKSLLEPFIKNCTHADLLLRPASHDVDDDDDDDDAAAGN